MHKNAISTLSDPEALQATAGFHARPAGGRAGAGAAPRRCCGARGASLLRRVAVGGVLRPLSPLQSCRFA